MPDAIVCVGGPPGGGKSTAGRGVARSLHFEYLAAGTLFREEAARRGMDVEAFNHYAEAHPEVDRTLDRTMAERAHPGMVLDGRIQGPLLRRRGVPVRFVVITAREQVRIERVARRDGQSVEEAARRVRERSASEHARYLAEYGIDLEREAGDLTVDSSDLTIDDVRERVLRFLEEEALPAP